jgi:hypothetical protein
MSGHRPDIHGHVSVSVVLGGQRAYRPPGLKNPLLQADGTDVIKMGDITTYSALLSTQYHMLD